jgi:hypothetical protein
MPSGNNLNEYKFEEFLESDEPQNELEKQIQEFGRQIGEYDYKNEKVKKNKTEYEDVLQIENDYEENNNEYESIRTKFKEDISFIRKILDDSGDDDRKIDFNNFIKIEKIINSSYKAYEFAYENGIKKMANENGVYDYNKGEPKKFNDNPQMPLYNQAYKFAYESAYDNAKYTTTLAHLFALFKEDQDERNNQMGIALSLVIISIAAAIYIEMQPYYVFCFKIQDKNHHSSIAVRSFIRENYEGDFFKHFPDQKPSYPMIKYNYFRMLRIRDLVNDSFKESLSGLKPQGSQGPQGGEETIYRYRESESEEAELQYVYRTTHSALELFENESLELTENKPVYCYYMILEDDLLSKLDHRTPLDESDFTFRTMSRKISSDEIERLYDQIL